MLKFSRIAVLRKRLQLDSKSDLTTSGLILQFFGLNMPCFVNFLSVWIEICKNCSKRGCFFDDIESFR